MSVKDKECGCCKYYIGDRKVEYSIFLNFYSMTYKGKGTCICKSHFARGLDKNLLLILDFVHVLNLKGATNVKV